MFEGEEEKRLVSDESQTDEHLYICVYSFLCESCANRQLDRPLAWIR